MLKPDRAERVSAPFRVARRQSNLSLALSGVTLSLGTLGFTTSAEAELIEIDARSYSQLPDGSLQVTFGNGRTAIVGSGDYTFVDGRLFIESSVLPSVGTSATVAANVSSGGFQLFGTNGYLVLGGAAAGLGGLYLATRDDDDDKGSSSGASSSSTFKAVNQLNTSTITNRSNSSADDAGTVIVSNLATLFEGASGSLTYAVAVENSGGTAVNSLAYVNGAQLRILNDPEADENGTYKATITATDSSNGETAQAVVVLTVDVESEASTKGTIAAVTMDENDAANAVVVSDVSVYFEDAEGSFSYSVEVKSGSQVYGGVVSLSGNQLQLAKDVTDSFVEQLNGTAGDEDITLQVTVTATDSADDTELTQSFDLTLDATGVNDAPELASGKSSTIIWKAASATASYSQNLSGWVRDEDGANGSNGGTHTWNITSDPSGHFSITNAGVLSGTLAGGDDDNREVEISVGDDDNANALTLTLYIDVA